jgi:hypothetical protein
MMRRTLAELAVTAALVTVATLDAPDVWRLLARACQSTALAIGRVGIYAEDRAGVLTGETA